MAGRPLAVGVLAATLSLAGCDSGGDTTTTVPSATTSSTQPTSTTAEKTTPPKQHAQAPNLYFTAGEQFKKVPADLPPGDAEKQAEAATQALIDGPPEGGHTTTQIPPDTEVEGVDVAKDGT